jgi:hypothetical protein
MRLRPRGHSSFSRASIGPARPPHWDRVGSAGTAGHAYALRADRAHQDDRLTMPNLIRLGIGV